MAGKHTLNGVAVKPCGREPVATHSTALKTNELKHDFRLRTVFYCLQSQLKP